MKMPKNVVIQNAYVINDLAEAMCNFTARAGYGPWLVIRNWLIPNSLYKGAPSELDVSVAFSQAGEVQIELIQQHSENASCYRDLYPKGKQGFHHTAMIVQDYEGTINAYEAAGSSCVQRLESNGSAACYIDTVSTTGHMLEIYSDCDLIQAIYRAVREVSAEVGDRNAVLEPGMWMKRIKM